MTPHVVIAGGGIGALEGLLALQDLAGDRVHISVLTAVRHLTYRPLSVAEPFGSEPAPRYDWEHIARDRGVRWIPDVLEAVRPDAREVDTRDGPPVPYDALLLAVGARPEPGPAGAITFSGPRDVLAIREMLEALAPERRHTIAFVVMAGTAWTLPLYELALMTAEYGRRHGLDLAIELITTESSALSGFGADASAALRLRLSDAGIRFRFGISPAEDSIVIALPRLRGPGLRGLPHDPGGFVRVNGFGRIHGVERVWAVGDMTTRPLKQGGLATQQADVAAADITAEIAGGDADVDPYRPTLQGMLLTGAEPAYLQREPLSSPAQKVIGAHLGPYLETIG